MRCFSSSSVPASIKRLAVCWWTPSGRNTGATVSSGNVGHAQFSNGLFREIVQRVNQNSPLPAFTKRGINRQVNAHAPETSAPEGIRCEISLFSPAHAGSSALALSLSSSRKQILSLLDSRSELIPLFRSEERPNLCPGFSPYFLELVANGP